MGLLISEVEYFEASDVFIDCAAYGMNMFVIPPDTFLF